MQQEELKIKSFYHDELPALHAKIAEWMAQSSVEVVEVHEFHFGNMFNYRATVTYREVGNA